MLFVVRTDPAIVRTPEMRFRMGLPRILGRFVIITDLFVIGNVISDQDFLKTMFAAVFREIDVSVLKDYFRVNPAVTNIAETHRIIIVDIIPGGAHKISMFSVAYKIRNRL